MKVYVLQTREETFHGDTYWENVRVTANKAVALVWDGGHPDRYYDEYELEDFNPIDNFTVTC